MPKESFRGRGVGKRPAIGRLVIGDLPTTSAERVIFVCECAEKLIQIPNERLLGVICDEKTAISEELEELHLPMLLLEKDSFPKEELNGVRAILDPLGGRLTVDPDLEDLDKFALRTRRCDEEEGGFLKYVGMPAVTPSGKRIYAFEEIGRSKYIPIDEKSSPDADGILLWKNSPRGLSEDGLEAFYLELMRANGSRPIIVTVSSLWLYDADGRDEVKMRIRALLRAAASGTGAINLSDTVSTDQIRRCLALISEAKEELRGESLPFSENLSVGITLDTPEGALTAEKLTAEAAFVIFDSDLLLRASRGASELHTARHREVILDATRRLLRLAASSVDSGDIALSLGQRDVPTPLFSLGRLWIRGALARDPAAIGFILETGVSLVTLPREFLLEEKCAVRDFI